MRVLILGGDGMLGHRLLMDLARLHEVRVTLRQEPSAQAASKLFQPRNSYKGVDVRLTDRLMEVLADFRPEVVVNAVGVVKQRPEAFDPIPNLEINALLPHRLATMCRAIRANLIHISTDCVFSGRTGHYTESDEPDPIDVYGHTKLLGEVVAPGCVTLRTSIIGRELSRKKSLLEWFLSQRTPVHGYVNAIYSGFTTQEMSRIINRVILQFPASPGVYHVSSEPISKFDLLNLIKAKLKVPVELARNHDFKCNRSLDSERFRRDFMYAPPSWDSMIEELAGTSAEVTPIKGP
jgi:dTDP-4-dehydrorhamnose reductase